jgi:hypothetical protein
LLEVTTLRTLQSLEEKPEFLNADDNSHAGQAAAVVKKTLGPMIQALGEFKTKLDNVHNPMATSLADWSAKWSTFSEWRKQWLDQWEAKVNALRSSVAKLEAEPLSAEPIKRVIGYLDKQTAALRLRESLGVEVDDEQIIRESVQKTLPPLDRF